MKYLRLFFRFWTPKTTTTKRYIYIQGGSYPRNYFYNGLKNTKYNIVTFLPLSLYQQFKIFMNLFYLLISLSQLVPSLRIGPAFTYFAPLTAVLFVSLTKEALEDYERYRRDKEANSQKYEVLSKDGLVEMSASNLTSGDIVKLNCGQRVPADLIFLRTSEASGCSYIRTDQLDGETDWKLRKAVCSTQQLASAQDMTKLEAVVCAEPPNKDIYRFNGTFTLYDNCVLTDTPTISARDRLSCVVEPLSVDNTLWMNTIIASGSIYGLVLYTGREVRASLNSTKPRYKVGKFDSNVNFMTKLLFLVCISMAMTLIIPNGFVGIWYLWAIKFILLFSCIIPISLRVNLDLAKFMYSLAITLDTKIPGTVARTSLIHEELGHISYLLSDKTGTLTQNVMNLMKIHIGRALFHDYQSNQISDLIYQFINRCKKSKTKPDAKAQDWSPFVRAIRSTDVEAKLTLALLCLVTCHNVKTSHGDNGEITYQASSPDEIALVKFAKRCGVELVERGEDHMTLEFRNKSHVFLEIKFGILYIFPFSSNTKRMGIVIQDNLSGNKYFLCKGAESVLMKLLQPRGSAWVGEECDILAREGLRTLVFGCKCLSDEDIAAFDKKYIDARVSITDREAKTQAAISTLEENLMVVALTGVEDKLQPDVKQTLESIRNAGIKVWMLTGDKVDTAKCIAISVGIKDKSHSVATITDDMHKTPADIKLQLEKLSMSAPSTMVIIDGATASICLNNFPEYFIKVISHAPSVLCCRCTPSTKAELVRWVKKVGKKRTCAIGDGGNDVPMIQEADVGVGIVGKEGLQASLVADYSIHQFSFLGRLLLWHGRNCYKKSATLTNFIFHRGMIISVIQGIFSAMYFYMPLSFFQGWLQIGFSTYYTMMPLYCLVLDSDIAESVVLMFPELYENLRSGRILSIKTFLIWFWISIFQGAVVMLGAMALFEDSLLSLVAIVCTSLFILEMLNISAEITTWHPLMIVSIICTVLVYFYSILILRNYFDLAFIMTISFWWKVLAITLAAWLPMHLVRVIKTMLQPSQYAKLEL